VQMEQILKSSVLTSVYGEHGSGHRYVLMVFAPRLGRNGSFAWYRVPTAEILRELSDSRWGVYDVLPTFFSHEDEWVALGKHNRY
jgi:acetyl-CoA carboxylase/biotin carboxylase 1